MSEGAVGNAHTDLLASLRGAVGPEHVLSDPQMRASYETDWTRRFHGEALCVVRPAGTAEVTAVLQACARSGVAVTVQGGNTGLVGGGVPAGGEVLLSTSRMTGLQPVDPVSGQVTVGAGVTLTNLQSHARSAGWDVGMDFAARDSATVGGMVSTNAGGERVIAHGAMRSQVAGLEAVLADGSVLTRLSGLRKDNTGYDLVGLLAGSEGTLAVVTQVRVQLVPLLTERAVALLALPDVGAALRALAEVKRLAPDLAAAELFLAEGLALVREHLGLAAPMDVDAAAYLLVEIADRTDPTDRLLDAVGEIAETSDAVLDAVIATDAPTRHRLWQYREAHTESINAAGIPVKLDVAVPLGVLDEAVQRLPQVVREVAPDARTILFGHVNEGNLHVNILGAAGREGRAERVTDAVLRLVISYGGSISAEHGIGRAKVEWLPLARSQTEIDAMRRIKRAWDPDSLLNPGVVLPLR